MTKQKKIFVWLIVAVVFGMSGFFALTRADSTASSSAQSAQSSSREDLQAQLQAKSKELDAVNQQLSAAKANLNSTKQERITLQAQVKSIQASINTLNLGIQADTLTTQKLQLQIQNLGLDIQDISASVDLKQRAVQDTLKEIQKNDATNGDLFVVFLKSSTLADGFLEAQSIGNLQTQLVSDINSLKDLHTQYNDKIQESAAKKSDIVAQQIDLQNKMLIASDQKSEQQNLLKTTQGKESVFQQQYAALQKQQQQIASDIEALDAILRAKINPSALPTPHAGVLAIPVQGDTENDITQGYGATDFAKNGYKGHWHNGVDLAASIGTPILAAEDGTIAAVGNNDAYCPKGAYGKFIAIDHNDGLTTLYGHLSRQIVQKGDSVKRGQIIGYSGKTGYATGPHLHFTVFAQATFSMSPSKYCGPLPVGGDLNPIGYLF